MSINLINNQFPFMNLVLKSESEFMNEYNTYIPSEGEIRLIANRNRECQYYYMGIQQCRKKIIKESGGKNDENHQYGFLPCKRLVDAHYRCMSEDKYGKTFEEVPQEAVEHKDQFMQCAFKDLQTMAQCRKYFDAVIRKLYRAKDTQLIDFY